MIRYREIMRLHSLGQPAQSIAAAAGCSRKTVNNVLRAAKNAGLSWPLPEDFGDAAIRQTIYPSKYARQTNYIEPDYQQVHEQLKGKGVTRALLYEEYCDACRAQGADSCSRSTFNKGYELWTASRNLTMHIERRPAEKMEVDWAGTKMQVIDRDTGEVVPVDVFVACLPFSGKLYAEGFFGVDSECWLLAHVHAFDFFGGVPKELVPDNCKTAVISHVRGCDVVLNRAYSDLASYYGCAISPARVRHPKDKANVEAGVGMVTRHAIAPLRNRAFFTLGELNAALLEKIGEINSAQFTRKPGSRSSVFEAQERSELSPLPKVAFPVCSWERATVRSDYHVAVRKCFYSVPFEYIGKIVDARITQTTVEIYYQDVRIASHARTYEEHAFVTNKTHMPQDHIGYLEWNAEGIAKRSRVIGSACERAISIVMSSCETKSKAIGQGKSLLSLSKRYGASILEEACKKALTIGDGLVVTVDQIECLCSAIYKANGDIEDSGEYAILRGADYYNSKGAN